MKEWMAEWSRVKNRFDEYLDPALPEANMNIYT